MAAANVAADAAVVPSSVPPPGQYAFKKPSCGGNLGSLGMVKPKIFLPCKLAAWAAAPCAVMPLWSVLSTEVCTTPGAKVKVSMLGCRRKTIMAANKIPTAKISQGPTTGRLRSCAKTERDVGCGDSRVVVKVNEWLCVPTPIKG